MDNGDQTGRWEQLALACGFTSAWPLDVKTLRFLPEVRAMCAQDKCRHYGKSWTCPPACGTLEEAAARAAEFEGGILVQTTGQLEDSFDTEGIAATEASHKQNFDRLLLRLRAEGLRLFPMGAGTCTRCKTCTYPDAPCRFPELVYSSMEACGLLVTDVCKQNGVPYYSGPGTITFTGCFLIGD